VLISSPRKGRHPVFRGTGIKPQKKNNNFYLFAPRFPAEDSRGEREKLTEIGVCLELWHNSQLPVDEAV